MVANLGGVDGRWGRSAREDIQDLFDLVDTDTDVQGIEVYRGERWTLGRMRVDKTFSQMGWKSPMRTKYLFCESTPRGTALTQASLDGHLPPITEPGRDTDERDRWAAPDRPAIANDRCQFDLDQCLGPFWTRSVDVAAEAMFKRLAFELPQCGDCRRLGSRIKLTPVIMALVTSSGPLGLSAFFPSASATYQRPSSADPPAYVQPPHLPLTPTWQEGNFSLDSVMANTSLPGGAVNLREYSMRLLSRYLYVSGRTLLLSAANDRLLRRPVPHA